MKAAHCRNLHLAGVDVVLPVVFCVRGRTALDLGDTVVSFAPGYTDATIAPLAAEWLSRHLRCRFIEGGRGADGNLAAEAFYDKLAREFANDRTFVAMAVSPRRMLPRSLRLDVGGGEADSPAKRRRDSHGHWPAFMTGTEIARWNFRGRMRAYVNPSDAAAAASAQVMFDGLPGGIELAGTGKFTETISRRTERMHEVAGWYGFGALTCSPTDAIATLRREFTESRDRAVETRVAAHA